MDYIGLHLTHKEYGEGIVEAVESRGNWKSFTVAFSDKTIQLMYPNLFEKKHAVAADPAVQEAILTEIEAAHKAFTEDTERRRALERETAALAASKQGKSRKTVVSEPSETIAQNNPLTSGRKYGTASKKIYEACIPAFGFAQEGVKGFGWNKPLYARAATREGYSVWMLAHSNWTDTENENWRNTISEGYRLITEEWGENELGLGNEIPDEIRVTFAKDGTDAYVFLGVFRCTLIDLEKRIKKYELIHDKYPI